MPAHLIAEEGPLRGLILNFEDGDDWIIGRDPDQCNFILEDSTVSRKHAQVSRKDDGVFIKNLSRVNPTLVNDEEIAEPHFLVEGDQVKIGNNLFLFSEEEISRKEQEESKAEEAFEDIFGAMEETPEEIPPAPLPKAHKEPKKAKKAAPKKHEEEKNPKKRAKKEESSVYDTIFEEGDSEEELPFSLISEANLILKVIAGPNAGAEIGLEKGRTYIIGKDANTCDIVFQDLSVSRNHARISIDNEGIAEIEDLSSKNGTLVNASPSTTKQKISSQDLITMGTTTFLVIDREAAQETIYSPLPSVYESARVEEKMEEEEEELVAKVRPKDWKKQVIPMRHLIFASSCVLVFFIIFLSFFSLFKAQRFEVAEKAPTDDIQDTIAKYDAVQFSFNPASGKLFLVGHVLTAVDHQELLYKIHTLPFVISIEDTIIIDELVWLNTNAVLTENAGWKGVSIHSPKAGMFVVNGYVQTPKEAESLADYLNVNFPYLDLLNNKVVVEQNLNTEIQSMLRKQGFDGVTFQLTNGEISLSGFYSAAQSSNYKSTVDDLKKVHGIRSVNNFAIASTAETARINISTQYQVTGYSKYANKNYSVVVNGQILTMGDVLNGMEVTGIQSNTILLERQGLKYKIDYMR